MRIIPFILLFQIVTCFTFAQQPEKLSYQKPYDLTHLDFAMDVPYFMSGSLVLKEFIIDDKDYKDDLSQINKVDMYHFCHWVDEKISDSETYIDDEDNIVYKEAEYKRWGILYDQSASINRPLATFHTLSFETFNVITDLEDRLQAVGVYGHDIQLINIKETLAYCNEYYINIPTKWENIYRWESDDHILEIVIENAPDNTFRFLFTKDEDGNLIDIEQLPNEDKIYTNVYFFILKKDAEKHLNNLKSGVFRKL